MKNINEHWKSYEYEYFDGNGIRHQGKSLYETDQHAVSYFRSLEENGCVKVKSIKNPQGKFIWLR